MSLHFSLQEFQAREAQLCDVMQEQKLDAVVLFAQESLYWLTGYDTFGFCFFQCLVFKADGTKVLLTRLPDLRQAKATSTIDNVVLWMDRDKANPAKDLRDLLSELELLGCQIGIEYNTHGLTAADGRALDQQLSSFGKLVDVSELINQLRLIKSPAEIDYIRQAAKLSDDAFEAALPLIKAGAGEAEIVSALMASNLSAGGDFPANDYIIGSGKDALLCRSQSGRRILSDKDQLTIEWSGVWRHYHAPMMRTIIIGEPSPRHHELYQAAEQSLLAMEATMQAGNSFSDIFQAHTSVMEEHDLTRHRLNASGYSVGARFAPSWMENEQFQSDSNQVIAENMALFAHVMLFDSDSDTAMTLARTSLVGPNGADVLSRHPLQLLIK